MNRLFAWFAIPIAALLLTLSPETSARPQGGTVQATDGQILIMLRIPPQHFKPNSAYSRDAGSYGNDAAAGARRRIAARIARARGLTLVDSWPMPLLGVDCFVMQAPAGAELAPILATLSRHPSVAWAQPMQTYRTQGSNQARGDPLYPVQPAAAWRLAELHRTATGHGITVAIIDSMVEAGHPDLAGQIALSRDFVLGRPDTAELHGTGIAGVIGARADNGLGIAGVAPGARIFALRACWEEGHGAAPAVCDTLSLAKALHFAIDGGAQIINLSLSGPPDRLLARLIDIAVSRRISIVAAYDAGLPSGGFPASQRGVIAVADQALQSRPLAVYGAPGSDVPTTQPGGKWYFVNGSSYAAAHISGLLALTRERRRTNVPQLAVFGPRGPVNACATVIPAPSACDCTCALAGNRARPQPR